jgi:hypothetical protein
MAPATSSFSRAGFAVDQHRASSGRHELDLTDHIVDGAALTYDAASERAGQPLSAVAIPVLW